MHIGEPVAFLHRADRHHQIFRFAGGRIDRAHRDHASDLEIGIDCMANFYGPRAGDELVMGSLIHQFFAIIALFQDDAAVLQQVMRRLVVGLVVDFIERHPVGDFVLVAGEAGFREFLEEGDAFPVAETAVLLDQMPRHFEMRQRDDRLDAVLAPFIKQAVLESQSLPRSAIFIAVREDVRPGDRRAEALEAHLRHQGDVFLVVMIEIDGFMVGMTFPGDDPVRNPARPPVRSGCHDVGDAEAFAAFLPTAFNLMGSDCAAP